MKLSIIIPVYNVEEYLAECLDSVLSLTDFDYEVICINDGSTDNSLKILNEYSKKSDKIKVFTFDNGGLSVARNRGLKIAEGDYVFFLDSDDYINGNIKKILDKAIYYDLDIIGFNALKSDGRMFLDENILIDNVYSGMEFIKYYYTTYKSFPGAPVWLYIYKRGFLLKKGLFFKEGILSEDEHYTYKTLMLAPRVGFMNEYVVYYRLNREGAITHKPDERRSISLAWIASDLFKFLTSNGCKNKIFYLKILKLYLASVRFLIGAGDFNKLKELIKKEDYNIMRQCVPDEKWYVHYWLLRYMPWLYRYYIKDGNSNIIKAVIARSVKSFYKNKNNK